MGERTRTDNELLAIVHRAPGPVGGTWHAVRAVYEAGQADGVARVLTLARIQHAVAHDKLNAALAASNGFEALQWRAEAAALDALIEAATGAEGGGDGGAGRV